nr:EOG090X0LZH [Eulimnadia texana]
MANQNGSLSSDEEYYKQKYQDLKKKLKFIIYENECFTAEIRSAEKRLLRLMRDRTFLLDKLMQLEGSNNDPSTDDEATDSSDGDLKSRIQRSDPKKKKLKSGLVPPSKKLATSSPATSKPKKKSSSKPNKPEVKADLDHQAMEQALSHHLAGHMTPEEVERHLESRRAQQMQLDFAFAPDKAPMTVPTEMFNNDLDNQLLDKSDNSLGLFEDDASSPKPEDNVIVDMDH